jgi:hypothetical protein
MRLKPLHVALLCAAMAAPACESGVGPGDDPLPADFSFVGTWELHVEAALNCWAAFDTRISITPATLTAGANGSSSLMNPEGWWFLAGTGPDNKYTLSGTLTPGAGTFQLELWSSTAVAGRGHFDGVASSNTRLGGTFTDPDRVFRASAGTHPCSAPAHAIRD